MYRKKEMERALFTVLTFKYAVPSKKDCKQLFKKVKQGFFQMYSSQDPFLLLSWNCAILQML